MYAQHSEFFLHTIDCDFGAWILFLDRHESLTQERNDANPPSAALKGRRFDCREESWVGCGQLIPRVVLTHD